MNHNPPLVPSAVDKPHSAPHYILLYTTLSSPPSQNDSLNDTVNIPTRSLELYGISITPIHYNFTTPPPPMPVLQNSIITLGSLESHHIVIAPFNYSVPTTPPTRTTKIHTPLTSPWGPSLLMHGLVPTAPCIFCPGYLEVRQS